MMEIGKVRPINIEDEMRGAYLDYAMSVITARALPDVRDGLKPVQRRILYAMDELALRHTNPYKKSARIVGEVLGKYHPHGDAPVYETMVRMAQDFSMRYVLVDGQGNFGSVDGDPPAAMRYTEARLSPIAEEMLVDIDKNTVDFAPNFDGSLKEPTILPAKLPNLLLNGSAGIAVGMATNIPPHNLNELIDAIVYMIGHFGQGLESGIPFATLWARVFNASVEPETLLKGLNDLTPELRERVKLEAAKVSKRPSDEVRAQALLNVVDEIVDVPPDKLMEFIKGPDFPTAGIILGEEGIKNAYTTGHGRIVIRAKAHIEDMRGGRQQIIVTQLPFQVNKATLQEKIAELVRDKRIEGISELRDESDRQGMRLVIELRRDAQARQVLNQLFKYTAMQSSFSINMLALVDGQPRVLTLKMILLHYVNYRKDVITRRTLFDLDKARQRAHILEGLKIALDNLDEVIATIRKSRDAETAKVALIKGFKLSEIQAQAILDMQLRRLAALERKKIIDELAETKKYITHLEDLLAHPAKILYLIRDELTELKSKYGDARRTRITTEEAVEFTEEDLVPDEPVVITISGKNYVKRMPADAYRGPRRGRGIAFTVAREDDPPNVLFNASTLDQIVFFSNRGRAFQVKVFDLPDVVRQGRGLPVSNLIALQPDEKIVGAAAARIFEQAGYVVLFASDGDVKRVALSEFASTRSSGANAFNLSAGAELIWAGQSDGKGQVIAVSRQGQTIRFAETDVRASGRGSGGMKGLRLGKGDAVVAAAVVHEESHLAVVTRNGFGKRTPMEEFPVQGRGGGGVRAATVSDKIGVVVGAQAISEADDVAIVSFVGSVFRASAEALPTKGRSHQVAQVMTLDKGDYVASFLAIPGKTEGKPTPIVTNDGSPAPGNGSAASAVEASTDGGKVEKPRQSSKGQAKAKSARSSKDASANKQAAKSKPAANAKLSASASASAKGKSSGKEKRSPAARPKTADKPAAKGKLAAKETSSAKSKPVIKEKAPARSKAASAAALSTKSAAARATATKVPANKAATTKAASASATAAKTPAAKAASSKALATKPTAAKTAAIKTAATKATATKATVNKAPATKAKAAKAAAPKPSPVKAPSPKLVSAILGKPAAKPSPISMKSRRTAAKPEPAQKGKTVTPRKSEAKPQGKPDAKPSARSAARAAVTAQKPQKSLFSSMRDVISKSDAKGKKKQEKTAKGSASVSASTQKASKKKASVVQSSLPLFGESPKGKKK